MQRTVLEWATQWASRPPIVASIAYKGGDGKSTLAREVAYQTGSVLVDFDWDRGCSSRSMGYRHERFTHAPLLEAFEKGVTPTPIKGKRKADLIPSHPDFVNFQPDPETGADALENWARTLRRPLMIDTHPGGCDSTYAALKAADVIMVPAVFAKESLNALEGMLEELTDHPLLIVPHKVQSPPAWARKRLRDMVSRFDVPVGPVVSMETWIPTRTLNVAVCSEPVAKRAEPYVRQIDKLVEAVINYAG